MPSHNRLFSELSTLEVSSPPAGATCCTDGRKFGVDESTRLPHFPPPVFAPSLLRQKGLGSRGVVVNFDLGERFVRPRSQQRGSLRPRARHVAVLGLGAGGGRPSR